MCAVNSAVTVLELRGELRGELRVGLFEFGDARRGVQEAVNRMANRLRKL